MVEELGKGGRDALHRGPAKKGLRQRKKKKMKDGMVGGKIQGKICVFCRKGEKNHQRLQKRRFALARAEKKQTPKTKKKKTKPQGGKGGVAIYRCHGKKENAFSYPSKKKKKRPSPRRRGKKKIETLVGKKREKPLMRGFQADTGREGVFPLDAPPERV